MNTLAEVTLWGRTIGALSLEPSNHGVVAFEYDHHFMESGIELAPLMMPLAPKVYRFPSLSRETFSGLPGLVADSLPDRFGNALINSWLTQQGRSAESFNVIERLCYTGRRGMGALEYLPATGPEAQPSESLNMEHLIQLAAKALQQKENLHSQLDEKKSSPAHLNEILQVGTSAGGARAKAVIAWHPQTQEVRSGQGKVPLGFEHWLLKFDGVHANGDRGLADPQGYGLIEFVYALMAQKAGIQMSECRLFQENGRSHFMTRRFDRTSEGKKLHMQSLGAMAHLDYNLPGANSYEQAIRVCKQLDLSLETQEELFRRMIFNLVTRNQDDHVKNIAFLMDKQGVWSLAPAYDITFNYNPDGAWTGQHQMSLNGKRDHFTLDDLKSAEKRIGLKQGRAKTVLAEVLEAASQWKILAEEHGVTSERIQWIQQCHRTQW